MNGLSGVLYGTLTAMSHHRNPGDLLRMNQRVRDAFAEKLSGDDVFGIYADRAGNFLHTLVTVDDYAQGIVAGVTISFHVNGVVTQRHVANGRIYYEVIGGEGRAFKFLRHGEDGKVCAKDFEGFGFQYHASDLAFSKVVHGTVARVKGPAHARFSTDAISRASNGAIHDLRIYPASSDAFHRDMRALFEELVSGKEGEWDRIFSLLFK